MQDYPMPVKQPIENYKLLRQDLKAFLKDIKKTTVPPGGGGGVLVLPYMGYIGMCHCEGYGFSSSLL